MGKPWADKAPYPFQGDGDVDGDDRGSFKGGPGEELPNKPSPDPGGDDLSKPGGTV